MNTFKSMLEEQKKKEIKDKRIEESRREKDKEENRRYQLKIEKQDEMLLEMKREQKDTLK